MTGSAGDSKVLIAVPSANLRGRIQTAFAGSGRITVVAEVTDARSIVQLCQQHRPDVLVLEPMLPLAEGTKITQELMKRCPTPILVISGGDDSERDAVRACLAAGAVDAFTMPPGTQDLQLREWNRALVAAVLVVSRIRVVTQFSSHRVIDPAAVLPADRPEPSAERHTVIAIGASTGGPAAITTVLAALSRPIAVPILLVLHVNQSFHPSLTQWLRDTTGHPVRTAEPGESLAAATGYVITAPPGRHLEVRGGLLALSSSPPRHSCRPSIDVLFDSIAADCGRHGVACLLTGMGRDGASGLLAVRKAGGATIAQDQATSVVYGMPAEAARLGAAQRILPIDQIGQALSSLALRTTIVS